jgi:hypothetical protein
MAQAQVHAWNSQQLFDAYRKVEDVFVKLKPDQDSVVFTSLRESMAMIQRADRNINQTR